MTIVEKVKENGEVKTRICLDPSQTVIQNKSQFKMKKIGFMGHIITEDGVLSGPNKVKAIIEMPKPDDKRSVQRFLGMVNYLLLFCPSPSDVVYPLHKIDKV